MLFYNDSCLAKLPYIFLTAYDLKNIAVLYCLLTHPQNSAIIPILDKRSQFMFK